MNKILAASILGLENKKDIINSLIERGITWIHYDVMDGEFVEAKSLSVPELIDLFSKSEIHTKDVHLMVNNPALYIEKLVGKADYISFHADAVSFDEMNDIVNIFSSKTKLGIALNPDVPVSYIHHLLDKLSFVLVMSVVAGKGGQKYMPEVEPKVKQLLAAQKMVQMDGGLNDKTIAHAFDIGATVLVSGSFIISNFEKKDLNKLFTK